MNNFGNRTLFRKITSLIDGEIGKNFRKANINYKYSKKYDFKDHLLSILLLQFSGSNGIRDIDCKYKKSPKISGDFKIPTYSQLSRLNKNKSCDMFRVLFLNILASAKRELKSDIKIKDFTDLEIIDSSVIDIGKKLAPSLFYQQEHSSIRMSTLFSYGTKLPNNIHIVPAKIGERNCIDNFVSNQNSIYLFDKGYYKYSWYDEMSERGLKFISRQQSNAIIEEYGCTYTGIDNLYDYTVTMGTDYSKNKTKHKYREILYFEDNSDEEYRLVTNIFDISAKDIVSLYKDRWDIELFFKWIKQHLTIKHWIGRTLNSVSIQIYCALIVYVLLLIIKHRFKIKYSLFDLMRKLRANILEKYAIKNVLLR